MQEENQKDRKDKEPSNSPISVIKDEFTSQLTVKSDYVFFYFRTDILCMDLIYSNNTAILRIHYNYSSIPLLKDDYISFLFDDGNIIKYTIISEPKKDLSFDLKSYRVCEISLCKEDIEVFSNCSIKKIRINTKNAITIDGYTSFRNGNDTSSVDEIQQVFYLFKQQLIDLNVYEDILIEDSPKEEQSGSCYVYIMKDEKNGCHKIGISNRPEYREKTLQSDKPFIRMLQAKEFPTRKIARAFESALHSVYADKNIRGEWFDLSEQDVADVIKTLR